MKNQNKATLWILCKYVHMCIYIYLHLYAHIFQTKKKRPYLDSIYVHIHICIYIHTLIYIYIHIYIRVCVCVFIHATWARSLHTLDISHVLISACEHQILIRKQATYTHLQTHSNAYISLET